MPDTDVPIPFPPDLAIEIISDSEPAADAETEANEYLASGVQEVWTIYPRERRVRVRRRDGLHDLSEDQVLETRVLPGFRAEASSLFAL